jgi:hypothetical protein
MLGGGKRVFAKLTSYALRKHPACTGGWGGWGLRLARHYGRRYSEWLMEAETGCPLDALSAHDRRALTRAEPHSLSPW